MNKAILPDNARIWIFQADRKMVRDEILRINEKTLEFLSHWSTHGKPLKAGAEVLYNVFLILSVDESEFNASGCSLDKLFHFIKRLELDFDIRFLDRDMVALLDRDDIRFERIDILKSQIKEGKIGAKSIIFNNLVSSKRQMETDWKIPLEQSWLKKYLPVN